MILYQIDSHLEEISILAVLADRDGTNYYAFCEEYQFQSSRSLRTATRYA